MATRSYRHPIEVQENQATQTGVRPAETWVTVLRCFAMVTPITANEQFRHSQNVSEATHVVRMRYWSTLTTKHRILYRDRALGITSIINEGELDRYHELICKESI